MAKQIAYPQHGGGGIAMEAKIGEIVGYVVIPGELAFIHQHGQGGGGVGLALGGDGEGGVFIHFSASDQLAEGALAVSFLEDHFIVFHDGDGHPGKVVILDRALDVGVQSLVIHGGLRR